jgi:poly(A) polymerase Pap1
MIIQQQVLTPQVCSFLITQGIHTSTFGKVENELVIFKQIKTNKYEKNNKDWIQLLNRYNNFDHDYFM